MSQEESGFMAQLLDTSDFPARWHCGNWTPVHGWTHVVSDVAVWGAYMAIPLVLFFFVRKRSDVPFHRIFILFGAFIAACGTAHLVEATLFWHPWYRLSAAIKVVTAIVSWATVAALIPVLPRALELPGMASLNRNLALEIQRREAAEGGLRARLEELERFDRIASGREDRILALKEEVNQLLRRADEAPRYATAGSGGEAE